MVSVSPMGNHYETQTTEGFWEASAQESEASPVFS